MPADPSNPSPAPSLRDHIRTSQSHPLRIDSVSLGDGRGEIGITFCPGKHGPSLYGFEWRRDLKADLAVIADWGAAAVVTLIEDHEFVKLHVQGLGEAVAELGMQWHHLPIRDTDIPSRQFEDSWRTIGPLLQAHLCSGRRVLVHCMGGQGRAGTIAARLLIELDESPSRAITRVRAVRDGAIENKKQENYVRSLSPSWFARLVGFEEDLGPGGYDRTRERLTVHGDRLKSLVNQKSFGIGRLDLHSLAQLRELVSDLYGIEGTRSVRILRGDAGPLHADPSHNQAVFQVASQFNMLEMASTHVTPEAGVTIYERDNTQGPACAIAAGAGTIYRNYFARVGDRVGQDREHQLNGLEDLAAELSRRLGEPVSSLLTMMNGYAMFKPGAVNRISEHLSGLSEHERDRLRSMLRVGVQRNVQVTRSDAPGSQQVTQVFCSALPIGYQDNSANWEPLAQLILDALYEATLWTATLNAHRGGSRTVLLTFVGGGVFANDRRWIKKAIERALAITSNNALDVALVYRDPPSQEDEAWVATLAGIDQDELEPSGRDEGEPGPSAAQILNDLYELSRFPSDWKLALGQITRTVRYCEDAGSAAWAVCHRDGGFEVGIGSHKAMTTQLTLMDAKTFGIDGDRLFADVSLLISGPEAPPFIAKFDSCHVERRNSTVDGEAFWCVRITLCLGISPSDPERMRGTKALEAVQGAHRHFIGKVIRTPTGKIKQKSSRSSAHSIGLFTCASDLEKSIARPKVGWHHLWDEDLLPEFIPAPSAPWNDISYFALTFDGDGSITDPPMFSIDHAIASDDATLRQLRAWLYQTQRGWRWSVEDGPPDEETMMRVRLVLNMIRHRISAESMINDMSPSADRIAASH